MDIGTTETHLPSAPSQRAGVSGYTPGTLLGDRYRIVALVGRGGMGEVYRADDLRLGQPVALKFLPPELDASTRARERLLAEVRSARTVSSVNRSSAVVFPGVIFSSSSNALSTALAPRTWQAVP